MATTEELLSQDGGPLERSHMRDMVQRNALEDVAHGRVAKRLETQRKAFVRKNTRDEEEMRTLLCRLQSEQPSPVLEDEALYFDDVDHVSDPEIHDDDTTKHGQSANPYPVTIVPKFPANLPKRTGSKKGISIPESPRSNSRRVTTDCEDVQDSMSAMTISQMSPPKGSLNLSPSGATISTARDDVGDWLASPDAISSVRRHRKTLSEQATRKSLIRTNSEFLSQDSSSVSSVPTMQRFRSNSLKDRRKQSLSKNGNSENRRGGSMKERKTTKDDNGESQRRLLTRSQSTLTRSALAEFNLRQEMKASRLTLDTSSEIERHSESTHGSGVKMTEKHGLTRKISLNAGDNGAKKTIGAYKKV